jgi:hypothetical protein
MALFDADTDRLNANEKPDWMTSLVYTSSFEDIKTQVLATILRSYPNRYSVPLVFPGLEACVAVKNQERTVVYSNAPFKHFFSDHPIGIGSENASFVFGNPAQISQKTDGLILEGVQSIDCEHIEKDLEGRRYTFRTFKYRLVELQDPEFYFFCVSRPIAFLGSTESEKGKSLSELFRLFQSMDEVDRTICRLDAKGELTKDIAAAVGLTSRSIENHRSKMLVLFQVQRPMELIRITIRLEDHGLLPP